MAIDFTKSKQAIESRRNLTEELRKYAISMVLAPNRWTDYKNTLQLTWQTIRFDLSELEQVPDDQNGVYSFVVDAGIAGHPHCSYLLYIGKAERQSLRKRIKQYFYEADDPKGRAPVQDMILDWHTHLRVCFATVQDVTAIDDLEDSLISAFVPPINQRFTGELGAANRALR